MSPSATVAEVLIAQLTDGEPPPAYTGAASCYIEFGNDTVARVDVEFLGGGAGPTGTFAPPSTEIAAEKAEFGASRRARWFGTG